VFVGHFAPALIAATHKDAPPLPILFIAAQLVDWLFFLFIFGGLEILHIEPGKTVLSPLDIHHMPYSHSLAGTIFFAAIFSAILFAATKNLIAASLAAAVAISHWFLDWLVHIPSLTLLGHPPKRGLGLWNQPEIEIPLELILIGGSLWLYAKTVQPKRLPLFVMLFTMLGLQFFSWFGPAETNVTVFSCMALLAFAIFTGLSAWMSRKPMLD
jgi:hypothetical protein